jgi:hypothetical protein
MLQSLAAELAGCISRFDGVHGDRSIQEDITRP